MLQLQFLFKIPTPHPVPDREKIVNSVSVIISGANTHIQVWSAYELPTTVVLKREPLGSLREEFLILGRKFAPGRHWGGKAVKKKLKFLFLFVYSTRKKCTMRLVQMGMSTVRKHKLLHHHCLNQFFKSTAWPH